MSGFFSRWRKTVQKASQRMVCHWTLNQRALIISYNTSLPQGNECVLLWVFLETHLQLWLTSINSLLYLSSFFQFKKWHKQYRRCSKICFWSEHVWKSSGEWNRLLHRRSAICQIGNTPNYLALSEFQWHGLLYFQSPPKGESANEENKEVLATPASEPSSQETTPEKGKNTTPLITQTMLCVWLPGFTIINHKKTLHCFNKQLIRHPACVVILTAIVIEKCYIKSFDISIKLSSLVIVCLIISA